MHTRFWRAPENGRASARDVGLSRCTSAVNPFESLARKLHSKAYPCGMFQHLFNPEAIRTTVLKTNFVGI
jgi:hypothetical protein